MSASYAFSRRISFYETDAMGIVHHSNYLRILEDARVDWLRHVPQFKDDLLGKFNFPVIQAELEYKSPLRFDDLVEVKLGVKIDKSKIIFEYQIYVEKNLKSTAKTVHAPWDNSKNTVVRPPSFLVDFIEGKI